jgi:two-component system sensor histidine kinase PilS (NtrC family)
VTNGINLLSDLTSRRVIRVVSLFLYFFLFQSLIIIQKPFLQYDFIIVFYLSFAVLFFHHFLTIFLRPNLIQNKKLNLVSYLADFLILMLFMKYFPYLSSFILVLQLFMLFVASFDLDLFELTILGFISSLGVSIINLTSNNMGSMQSVLSLTLFNLSYASVIIISRQLKSEFVVLQSDLSFTKKRWKTQEELANKVMENIPLGIAIFDRNGSAAFQNKYLSENLSLSEGDVLKVIHEKKTRGDETLLTDFDIYAGQSGRKILNIDQTTYFDSVIADELSMYLIRDVTEIRNLEFQSKQNEKLAAIGQLAAGIAHEIRNPLAGISGSIQLLSQDTQDETQEKLMKIILKEIDRLNLLITEFLDYAKPEKKPDSKINVKSTLEEVLVFCRRHPDVKENFIWEVELNDVQILGFNEKLKQAFLNIIINGIQAMKDSTESKFIISLKKEGQFAVVNLKDSGCGMSEETKKKMFEPFHTTKLKGTGLGLAVTYKILEVHRAGIVVNTELNKGTEFIIKFPIA